MRVYPNLGIHFLSRKTLRAYAFWTLARHADSSGAGLIILSTLRAEALHIGIPKHFFTRAFKQATKENLIVVGKTRPDGEVPIIIRSLFNIAKDAGIRNLGASPVDIPPNTLRSLPAFKAALFGAWHTGASRRAENPISRKSIENATDLPERTQRNYERRVGVKATRNCQILNIEAKSGIIEGLRETTHFRGAFPVHDPLSGKTWVAVHKPNTYKSPYPKAPRRGMKSVNLALRIALKLDEAPGQRYERLFYDTREQAEEGLARTIKRTTGQGRPAAYDVSVVFYRYGAGNQSRSQWLALYA